MNKPMILKRKEYCEPGLYCLKVVTDGRKQVFGTMNDNPRAVRIDLNECGERIEKLWLKMQKMQAENGRKIRLLGCNVLPDHFIGLLYVDNQLCDGLGAVVKDFKTMCTVDYAVTHGSVNCSELLWDDEADEVIWFRKGDIDNIVRYVQDAPRRAVMKASQQDLYRKRMHIMIGGVDFAAYGNLFLLRRPWKEQVFCHRWRMDGDKRDYSIPYETTDEYRHEHEAWIEAAEDGAVLVTPGISKGEQQVVKDCLDQELPLIHLQMEPLTESWHPEYRRYELCAKGKLLILSLWQLDEQGDVNGVPANTSYSRFHNLNAIAEMLCGDENLEMKIRQ